ncbi:hypothetical protein CBG46_10035 [Actinobacillus succinogenes]|uniref:Replication P family protein n=1 Tax=Actinobacillus succinogenes (strain ATCC 55618 / DSM 22257 / CCUG 43843 / 130Z) TaxID=339671 RepID=A6VNN4_ACTSZ|nr:replication protein P [Actinobacillus succinogenes]ABR74581.1 replication P family protein [Actinobacillus succinogenes 130Z]PHI40994.1 hypothetical protein CBG46_10035 [Actinobacillus succinogenes]
MNQLTQKQQVRSTYVPERAKDMVDRIFENLTASCPILLTISGEQLDILKQQWILGFAENEIKTFEQVKRGMAAARAKPNGYLPSVGEFIGWCKAGNKYAHLGLPSADELARRAKAFMGYGFELEDQFAFASDLEYWLITDVYRKCKVNRWNDKQFDAGVKETLDAWAGRLSSGESIPERRRQIPKTVKIKVTDEKAMDYLAKMRSILRGNKTQNTVTA